MVIYLRIRRRWFYSIIVFVLLILVIYTFSYIKFDDKAIVKNNVLMIENRFLKNELDMIESFDINYEDYVIGKVLYRDLYSFYDEMVINVGDDLVSVGDGVVSNDGLVGVVYKTNSNLSYVKLLTGNYNVSVSVNDTYGNLNNGIISLLDKYSDIKVGDLVYTSSYGDVISGIYVGKVTNIFDDKDGLGKSAEVELVNNKNLNYIGVLKKIK